MSPAQSRTVVTPKPQKREEGLVLLDQLFAAEMTYVPQPA
jgi:hypothetical protein